MTRLQVRNGQLLTCAVMALMITMRADALVLLGIIEHNDQRFLQMTISDCRYGARLGVEHFPIVEGKADEAVSRCTAAINATRERFPAGVQQMIGVPPFVSRNLTHDYDHLQSAYASLVAESLRAQPGVAVIEIDEAQEIRKELALAGDRLEQRVVPLFVEGTYKVTAADPASPPTIEIDVRLTDEIGVGQDIHEKQLSEEEVIRFLREDLPRQILQGTESRRPGSLTAAQQRELLRSRAETFFQLGEYEHATALREAALLLQADDWRERLVLIGYYRRWFEFRKLADDSHRLTDAEVTRRRHADRLAIFYKMLPHVEILVRRRQLNLGEAVQVAAMACRGITIMSLASENEYGGQAKQVADEFFWRVYPAIPGLDASLRKGSYDASLQKMMGWQVREIPPSPRERQLRHFDESAIFYILAHSPRPASIGRSLSHGDYSRTLDDLYRYLTQLAPPWPTQPGGNLVVANLNRLIETGCLTQEDVRAFYQRLIHSGSPLAAFYGRCGLLSLDLNVSQDAKIDSRALHEIDSLLESVHRFDGGESYRRGEAKYLTELLGQMRSAITRRIDGTVAQKRHELPPNPIPAIVPSPQVTFVPIPSVECPWYGLVKCNDSLDVMWSFDSVFVMRQRGDLDKIFTLDTGSNYYRPTDQVYSAGWDGRNVWVATMSSGVFIVSPDGEIVGQVDLDDGLPLVDAGLLSRPVRGYVHASSNSPLRLHPISLGRCLAIGQYGKEKRIWIALLSLGDGDDDATYRAKVFHTATKDSSERRAAAQEDPEALFTPSWLLEHQPPDAARMLLVGRQFGNQVQPSSRPLAIDLDTFAVNVFPSYFPTPFNTGLCARFGIGGSIVFAGPRQIDLLSPPEEKGQEWNVQSILERPNLQSTPRPHLLQYQGSLYNPGELWTRIDCGSWEAEPLNTTPTLHQYRFENYGVSAHYGMIAWNADDRLYQVSIDAAVPPAQDPEILYPHIAAELRGKHHRAVTAIRELGGSVDARWGTSQRHFNSRNLFWRTLVYLSEDWRGGDRGLTHLQDLQGPLELCLVRADVSDEGMSLIGTLAELILLELVETKVTDDGLRELSKLEKLIECRLEGTAGGNEFTDRGLTYFGGMKSLRTLTLYGAGFTDTGLRNFENPRNIYELHLYDTAFTGSGLAQLVRVKRGLQIYENGSHRTFK